MDDLAKQAARGNREAMRKIVAEHYAAIYRFCARRLGPDLAEDAAQETFIMAYRTINRYDSACALRSWLFGIGLNVCRNLSRKRKVEIDIDNLWSLEGSSPTEDRIVDNEALRLALKGLSPEHLDVVILHELEGLTYDEAGVVLDSPSGTVKSRLHEAFKKLRAAMVTEVTK